MDIFPAPSQFDLQLPQHISDADRYDINRFLASSETICGMLETYFDCLNRLEPVFGLYPRKTLKLTTDSGTKITLSIVVEDYIRHFCDELFYNIPLLLDE